MLRTLAIALAFVVAGPTAQAKKRHPHAVKHAPKRAATKARPHDVLVQTEPPPTKVAAVEQHPAPAVVVHAAPTPAAPPAASPPVEHGPLGPQDGDDEVPGTRQKKR
ncbi:MAG TPA: hypothetical protein VGL86_08490 [Polyangia bacterium]